MIRRLFRNKGKEVALQSGGERLKCGLSYVIAMVLLSAGLNGCIADKYDGSDGTGGKLITFTPAVNDTKGDTRAATGHPIENGDNIPVNGSFGVYAYSQLTPSGTITSYDNELTDNTRITRSTNGTDFTYNPIAKWPIQADAKLVFYGYYPWQEQSSTPPSGAIIRVSSGMSGTSPQMTIEYTTPTENSEQVDLMYACTPMTSGFDAVAMNFHHALTRVNFKAKVEDYTLPVIITSIIITDVQTGGKLTVADHLTTPVWSSLAFPENMELNTSNGLNGSQLSQTLVSATTPGADLLLIPQSVQDLEVVVEATLNGTKFPEPFVFPLKGTPDWVKNQIVTYEITLSSSGMKLVAKFGNWDDNHIEVIQDGQWWMTVDKDELTFDPLGDTGSIIAETNYNINSQGYSAGLSASVPPEYNWLAWREPRVRTVTWHGPLR